MSYDLSFEKRHLWGLGVMTVLCALLLVAAGYFAGRLAGPAVLAAVPVVKLPEVKAPELHKDDPKATAKEEPSGSIVADPAPATPEVAGNAAVPAPGETPAAVKPALAAPEPVSARAPDPAPSKPAAAPVRRTGYTLQFGVFTDRAGAKALATELNGRGLEATVAVVRNEAGEEIPTVRYGNYSTLALAVSAASAQSAALDRDVVVRPSGRL